MKFRIFKNSRHRRFKTKDIFVMKGYYNGNAGRKGILLQEKLKTNRN